MPRPAGHMLNRAAWDDMVRLKGLTVTQVSELSGIPRPTVSALIGGHNRAAIDRAHALARALDCKPETIFPTLADTTFKAAS